MSDVGRMLIVFGAILAGAGVLLVVAGKFHLPLGRLPGDFVFRGKNSTLYFPLATSILVSAVLSLVFYALGRLKK